MKKTRCTYYNGKVLLLSLVASSLTNIDDIGTETVHGINKFREQHTRWEKGIGPWILY